MATLLELLSIPLMSKLTLLNKPHSLDCEISTVEISETPDVAKYMEKDAILITTAMYFADNPQDLKAFILSLSDNNCAALAIKLGRFIDEIPEEILIYAEELNFPILKISSNATLGEISHKLLSYIWDIQTERLNYAIQIQEEFSKVFLNDGSVNQLMNKLARVLKRPVLLISPLLVVTEQCTKYSTHYVLDTNAVDQLLEDIQKTNTHRTLKELTFYSLASATSEQSILLSPVFINPQNPYILAIFSPDNIPYPFSHLVIEQATNILSLMIFNKQKIKETNKENRSHVLRKLIRQTEYTDIEQQSNILHAKEYGLTEGGNYNIILFSIDEVETLSVLDKDKYLVFAYEWLEKYVPIHFYQSIIFNIPKSNQIAVILQHQSYTITESLEKISNDILRFVDIHFSIGIGSQASSINALPSSFIEAQTTLEKGYANGYKNFIHTYTSSGLDSLTHFIPDTHARYFSMNILGELTFPKDDYFTELRTTLNVYLSEQCDITATAQALFIHRNTVKYRIRKIEELLNLKVNHPQTSLHLRLALLLSE